MSSVKDLLASAELWRSEPPQLVAGWEDAYPFCAAICSTDAGLSFCRRCPEAIVSSVHATRRPAHGSCPAGVRLLAFEVPSFGEPEVVVLRVAPPDGRRAAAITPVVRVPTASLRRAARETPRGRAWDVLRAVRVLRSPAGRMGWQVAQRQRCADRQRVASATLAQFIVATEEFQGLYRNAVRQRGELERARRLADRLARDAVHVREHERARIAHQIHDTAAQSLVSAVRYLDAATGDLRALDPTRPGSGAGTAVGRTSARGHLEVAQERLRTAIGEMRAILDELIPAGLELGLDQAIRYRHRDLLLEAGLTGTVQGSLPRLQPWVEQVIFGMASEAMTNAARHAGGETLTVECATVRDRVIIVVLDDGRGIARARAHAVEARAAEGQVGEARTVGGHGGLGLAGLARQARWLGGATRIRDRASGGTSIRISVPLNRYRIEVSEASAAPLTGVPA